MTICPFCQYANEEGSLYCEQCKSDLGMLEADTPPPAETEVPAPPIPVEEAANFTETVVTVPVATPVDNVRIPPVEVAPVATAPAVTPIPVARAVEGFPAPVAVAAPVNVDTQKSFSYPVGASATLSSVQTFSPSSAAAKESTSPTPASRDTDVLPLGGKPRLLVQRGQRINLEYPLYEGDNYIGRADEKPVDIDLEDQEPPDRIWSSRQHALIHFENGTLVIEDLNSSNGTFINRNRLYPGQRRVLHVNDIIQIGTVQMKVVV
jgi:FHA domain